MVQTPNTKLMIEVLVIVIALVAMAPSVYAIDYSMSCDSDSISPGIFAMDDELVRHHNSSITVAEDYDLVRCYNASLSDYPDAVTRMIIHYRSRENKGIDLLRVALNPDPALIEVDSDDKGVGDTLLYQLLHDFLFIPKRILPLTSQTLCSSISISSTENQV